MLSGFALHSGPRFHGVRWIAYGAPLACAAALAFGLFALMTFLIRVPRPPAHHRTFSVFLREGALRPSPAHRERAPSRKRPPRLRPAPESAVVTAPQRPLVPRPIRTPSLPDTSFTPQLPALKIVSPATSPVEWRQALGRYMSAQSRQSPFAERRLPARRTPALDLGGLTRLRTGDGAEIDRIGDRCYGVPAADQLPEVSADPGYARFMQALQPLFAHQVPCPGVSRDSLGAAFLKALQRKIRGAP